MKKEKFNFMITEEGVEIKFRLKHTDKTIIGYMEQAATILNNISRAYRDALIKGGIKEEDANSMILAMAKTAVTLLKSELFGEEEEEVAIKDDLQQLLELLALTTEHNE